MAGATAREGVAGAGSRTGALGAGETMVRSLRRRGGGAAGKTEGMPDGVWLREGGSGMAPVVSDS
jgi:hypothetical protein